MYHAPAEIRPGALYAGAFDDDLPDEGCKYTKIELDKIRDLYMLNVSTHQICRACDVNDPSNIITFIADVRQQDAGLADMLASPLGRRHPLPERLTRDERGAYLSHAHKRLVRYMLYRGIEFNEIAKILGYAFNTLRLIVSRDLPGFDLPAYKPPADDERTPRPTGFGALPAGHPLTWGLLTAEQFPMAAPMRGTWTHGRSA